MSISCTDFSTDLDDEGGERNDLSHKIWDLVASVIKQNDMELEKSNSDQEHIDQILKTFLQDNVDKVGKVFILIKHYFHFSLVVWDIKDEKMTHYNFKLPRIQGHTDLYFDHAVQVRDKIQAFYKDFKGDGNITIDIERCLTCAQPNEDSLDCGIFVI